jgi:tetratricopeptide (TPR) repeat protein
MNLERIIFWVRVLIAFVLGSLLFRFAESVISHADIAGGIMVMVLLLMYGVVLFLLFGHSFLNRIADPFVRLYLPGDENFRIAPEYSIPEARVNAGKYAQAIEEYRKVIVEHPEDIYPHLRIADIALKHLQDAKTAELDLMTALAKSLGEDSAALAAGRLADLYQHTLHEPARALEVMKQLREKIPGTKQAKLAEERIDILEGIVHVGAPLPESPGKIAARPSRFKLSG